MDDRELLQILQKNPENGMRLVMKEYTGLCYYIVKQKLADFSAEEIEECVSDVFLAFYHQYTAIDLERGSIKGFLSVLSRRKAVDRWRKLQEKKPCLCRKKLLRQIHWNSRKIAKFCWMRFELWVIQMEKYCF